MIFKAFSKIAICSAVRAWDAVSIFYFQSTFCKKSTRTCHGISLKQGKMTKKLAAFDFDHTIVQLNTDLHVKTLAPNGEIPQEISDLYSDNSWTNYMGSIFQYLHSCGIKEQDMKDCMNSIPLVEGMLELLQYNTENGWENIIISDSNSVFIDYILENYKIKQYFTNVYTNPARFNEDGVLNIRYYHMQDWCDLSTENLCKGHILMEHINQKKSEGIDFTQVVYVGDGTNDLCPSLRLGQKDIVFPRQNFRLAKKIKQLKVNEKNLKNEENALVLKAPVFEWETGYDILQVLQIGDKK